jgi:hypothetical protein
VCCDGSYPYFEAAPGALCEWNGDSGTWLQGAGRCASRRGYGKLSVQQAVDAAQLAPTVAANPTVRMLVDDQLSFPQSSALSVARDLHGPACLRFETLDLARGDIFVDERCVGSGRANPRPRDPGVLARSCPDFVAIGACLETTLRIRARRAL